MALSILLARGNRLLPIPQTEFEKHLAVAPERHRQRQEFMTEAHHRVRYFVVQTLVRLGRPLGPRLIAQQLSMPEPAVQAILADLERNLLFLVRNHDGDVTWAFPLTVEPTAHRLRLSTGEAIYGAWAEDAIAVPFVQGHISGQYMSGEIETACAHCGAPLHITVDSELRASVAEPGAAPLVFQPDVDFASLRAPNIIDAYWRNSIFFWSEEHAQAFRRVGWFTDGVLLTLEQSLQATRIVQGALFAFDRKPGVKWFVQSIAVC